jgi:hypothetical protein
MQRYVAGTEHPSILSGLTASLPYPLQFEPGTRWDYGIGIDWLGRVTEAVDEGKIDQFCGVSRRLPRGNLTWPICQRVTSTGLSPASTVAPGATERATHASAVVSAAVVTAPTCFPSSVSTSPTASGLGDVRWRRCCGV